MKLLIPVISQRDPPWASIKLGTSDVTIGGYGCTITCMTMLSLYYGRQIDVPTFNKATIDAGGYASGNLYIWQSITTLFPDIKFTASKDYPLTAAPLSEIKNQLNEGKPVLVWVDINPNQLGNQMHWILLKGVEGEDFWANDPWYGDEVLVSKRYGDPKLAFLGHRFFSGPVPQNNQDQTLDPLAACLVAHTEAVNSANKKDEIIKQMIVDMQASNEEYEKKISEMGTKILELENKILELENKPSVSPDLIAQLIDALKKLKFW